MKTEKNFRIGWNLYIMNDLERIHSGSQADLEEAKTV